MNEMTLDLSGKKVVMIHVAEIDKECANSFITLYIFIDDI